MKISDSSPTSSLTDLRKRITAVVAILITLTALVFFVVYHIYNQRYLVVALDGIGLSLCLLLLFYLRKTANPYLVYLAICGFLMGMFGITTFLGRTDISYFLWSFVLPIACFSLLGAIRGVVVTMLFLLISLFLMTAPENIMLSEPYNSSVVSRYCVIYLIITLASYYYESSQKMMFMQIQKEKNKYERDSKLDPLTEIFNRREMLARMQIEQKRQLRHGDPFTLIIGDIDNFKNVNDTFGHEQGDHVLKMLARIMKDQIRNIDCICRWGGEEFLIMLVETDLDNGQNVAERIRKNIETAEFEFKNLKIAVTITCGLSAHHGSDDTIESCIKRADQALYRGKTQGKNRIVVA
jgi:diguanylate cyclase (GGDEF)-like protein